MIAIDIGLLILIILGVGASVSAIASRRANAIQANALPALRGETSYAKAATKNHRDLQRCVHLLERVLREDAPMPRLSGPLVREIEQYLADFYDD